jgi:hypothetical protein
VQPALARRARRRAARPPLELRHGPGDPRRQRRGPGWQYQLAYPLPTNCLRLLSVTSGGGALDAWEVQAGSILCDEPGPLEIGFIQRIDDPRLYDPLLCEALTARLSATLAYPITASTALAQSFWALYAEKLREARGVDAREAAPMAAPAPTSWLAAKLGG